MNIVKDFKNSLLNRREIELVVNSESNPGVASSVKMVAEKFEIEDEKIAIKRIVSRFGRDSFTIDACLYDSKEDKERIEAKKKVKKGGNN